MSNIKTSFKILLDQTEESFYRVYKAKKSKDFHDLLFHGKEIKHKLKKNVLLSQLQKH